MSAQRRWYGAWRSVTWASARGMWKKPTPEEEAQDVRSWAGACAEEGRFTWVFWCEVRQLVRDVLPGADARSPRDDGTP